MIAEVLGRDAAGKIPPAVLQSTVKPDRVFNHPIRPFREFHLRVHCLCLPTPRSLGRPQVGFATLGLVTHQTSCYEVDTTPSQSFSMSCRLQYSLAAAQMELSAVISGVGPNFQTVSTGHQGTAFQRRDPTVLEPQEASWVFSKIHWR
jgi:hypothetical protein